MKLKKVLLVAVLMVSSSLPLFARHGGGGHGGHHGGGHHGGHGHHGGRHGGWHGGRGYRHGGWGWGGGVGLGVGVAVGVGLGAAYYTRPYGYYTNVNMCWADMEQLRAAYKQALDRIKSLEAQLGE